MNLQENRNRIKRLLEQFNEPSMSIIVKLFKILNEEKKKNKTRESLLDAIKKMSVYMLKKSKMLQQAITMKAMNRCLESKKNH